MSEWENYLEEIYFSPSHPASYEGPKKLYEVVRKENKFKISHNQIKSWLQKQNSYSINKTAKRNFQRSRVIVAGIDDQFDTDLASFIPYSDDNDGYKYLLAVIDIFSRYAWVEPLKDKTANEIVRAFDKILSSGRVPRRLRSDGATDFTSKKFQDYVKSKNIKHFTTHGVKQANYVERFIKTIKSKIYRYIVQNNTPRYIDILPQLVNSYNNSYHSGIKEIPSQVNKDNEKKLWWQMYWPDKVYIKKETKRKRKLHFKFNIGDKVRVSYRRSAFERAYNAKWSSEIFKIIRRFKRDGQPIYKISDWFNKPEKGTFYQAELQKVHADEDSIFLIDKIIKYKGRGKNRQVLVSWKGWPAKFNSWISQSELIDLKQEK